MSQIRCLDKNTLNERNKLNLILIEQHSFSCHFYRITDFFFHYMYLSEYLALDIRQWLVFFFFLLVGYILFLRGDDCFSV